MVNAAQWQLLVNEINTISFADALSKGKIQRKCQNLGGHYTLASPHSKFWGTCPPPRFTPLASAFVYVDPAKVSFTSSLITMQNLVIVSHTVCAHVGGPPPEKNQGRCGPFLGMGAWLTPRIMLLQSPSPVLCYRTKFSHSMRAYYGDPTEKFDPSRLAFQGRSRSMESTVS